MKRNKPCLEVVNTVSGVVVAVCAIFGAVQAKQYVTVKEVEYCTSRIDTSPQLKKQIVEFLDNKDKVKEQELFNSFMDYYGQLDVRYSDSSNIFDSVQSIYEKVRKGEMGKDKAFSELERVNQMALESCRSRLGGK